MGDARDAYRLDLAARAVASALACVVRRAQERGVVEQRRARDRLEPVEPVERRSKPGSEQVPRGCDRASHDEVGGLERLQPRSECLAQRRGDVAERGGSALVAVATADCDLGDVDFGRAVALDQRGPGDRRLDRGAAVREAVDLTGRRNAGRIVDDVPVCQEGTAQPTPQRRRHDPPAPLCRSGPPLAERERIRIVEELHRVHG